MTGEADYERAITQGGWIDRSGRARLTISGPDRAKFLHNLVTSDIKRLPEGSGSEAFVTSPQGKVIAYLSILATASDLLLRTESESLEGLLPHLRKYGVFDDVEILDVSASTFEGHLIGPRIDQIIGESIPTQALGHRLTKLAGAEIRVIRESPTGWPGLTLIGPIDSAPAVRNWLATEGLAEIPPSTFESLRIEAGTPFSGRDVTPNHLPQEVGRDSLAINFVKGCYLGQETVARLDALGHVNKILKGVRLLGDAVPEVGTSLYAEGKAVGSITSVAWSPGWGQPVALAYVRVTQAKAGTELRVGSETAETRGVVADLPMIPPPRI